MNTNAEIITIGDEILIGQITDTNSGWIALKLNSIGINVYQMTSISDNKDHIINALDQASSRADLIIVTGGLGPTKDDITKQTIADYFNSRLIPNEHVLAHIRKLLEPKGIKINELNIGQANLPDNCIVLHNACGTAPGMWFEKNGKVFIFMPGVPFEMKSIVTDEFLPRLQKHYKTPDIVHRTLMLTGIAESMLAQHIEPWETQLPSNIKLAYLPSPGIMRLRLSAKGDDKETLTKLIDTEVWKLMPYIRSWYYAENDELLEVTIGKILKDNNLTVATAESCTGGKIASMLTSVPGSSAYFMGSIVAYSNEVKASALNISPKLIDENGAVSQLVVEQMAQNILEQFEVNYAVATSGIAGPDGGTMLKPVGTVWIAIASKEKVVSKLLSLGDNDRERNIQRSAISALNELRKHIIQTIKK